MKDADHVALSQTPRGGDPPEVAEYDVERHPLSRMRSSITGARQVDAHDEPELDDRVELDLALH